LASVDENFTGEHLAAYRDVEALNKEIADFVHASRTLQPKAHLYLSYYLSNGSASICVIRENGNFRVELRTLKPKETCEFSDLKRHRIKKSDSRNNVTPFALGNLLFPPDLHYHQMEFLYFLSDFDEVMTGKKLEAYTFKELQNFIPVICRFMKDISQDAETELNLKLSNGQGSKAIFHVTSDAKITISFDPPNEGFMEKLNRQFPCCED